MHSAYLTMHSVAAELIKVLEYCSSSLLPTVCSHSIRLFFYWGESSLNMVTTLPGYGCPSSISLSNGTMLSPQVCPSSISTHQPYLCLFTFLPCYLHAIKSCTRMRCR